MNLDLQQDQIERLVELAAPVSRVWRALTDSQEFGEWFQVRLDSPFEIGKTTRGKMTFPGQEHVEWESLTEEIDPERLFAFSWPPSAIDPDTDYSANAKIRVEFRLEPSGRGARLTLTESGFLQFPEAKRLAILSSIVEGWDLQLKSLAAYVAS